MKKSFVSILSKQKKTYLRALSISSLVVTVGLSYNSLSTLANNVSASTNIDSEKAMEIALKSTDGGTVTKCRVDYEDGALIYEIEIVNNDKEYDVDVNASNGKIIKQEYEILKNVINTSNSKTNNSVNEISAEKAKEIALKKTGGGTVIKWEEDYENGKKLYEIEIIKGNSKFDMDIGAIDSKIYNYKKQKINNLKNNTFISTLKATSKEITDSKAKEIALAKSGGGEVIACQLDYENGRKVYEIEILNNNVRFEMDIAAKDGTIYDFEEKTVYYLNNSTNTQTQVETKSTTPSTTTTTTTSSTGITAEEAKKIALAKTGGGVVEKCELDYENGVSVYEIEIRNGNWDYDIDVNVATGKISQFDKDYDD